MAKKILVVDDELDFVNFLRKKLESSGFDVLFANTAEDGLQKAREGKPDLIVLDLFMPEMDGYEVLRELKTDRSTKQVPVIIVSAWISAGLTSTAREFGVVDYLPKPFKFETLLSYINRDLVEK